MKKLQDPLHLIPRRLRRFMILFTFLMAPVVVYIIMAKETTHQHLGTKSSHVKKPLEKNQIILMTYGRSGSTFTAALISHHPSVFYTSEPLHYMPKDIYSPNISASTTQKAWDTMDAFLDCDFGKLDAAILNSPLFEASSTTLPFYRCLKNVGQPGTRYIQCFLDMARSCNAHNTTFIKVIRFRHNWIYRFLAHKPTLKILYLVRDFRAALYSHAMTFRKFNFSSFHQLSEKAKTWCFRAKEDVLELVKLKKQFPGRILAIRYEDGCINPQSYTRKIYDFLGLSFNNSTLTYISTLTKARSNRTGGAYSIVRQNPVWTMNRWRKSVNFSKVQEIDRNCGTLYPILGYIPVISETDLLSNRSLVTNPGDHGLF